MRQKIDREQIKSGIDRERQEREREVRRMREKEEQNERDRRINCLNKKFICFYF